MMRFFNPIFLVFTLFFAHPLTAEDSIEDLLNQADDALRPKPNAIPQRSKPQTEPEFDQERPTVSQSRPSAKKKVEIDTSTAIKPIENPQIDEIVRLDIKHKEAERVAARSYAAVSLMLGNHNMGAGYEMEKDEDTFTTKKSGGLSGGLLQLNTPRSSFSTPTAPWGYQLGLRAGYFSGDVGIQRRGVVEEERRYQYRIIPVDFYAGVSHKPKSWLDLQLTVGIGGDFYYQEGSEETDTLTDMAFGSILGFSVTWHMTQKLSFLALVNRRGFSPSSNGQSIAGTTVALGTQFGLFY